jgi:hypothetical protein
VAGFKICKPFLDEPSRNPENQVMNYGEEERVFFCEENSNGSSGRAGRRIGKRDTNVIKEFLNSC